jgi:hypothetical protein
LCYAVTENIEDITSTKTRGALHRCARVCQIETIAVDNQLAALVEIDVFESSVGVKRIVVDIVAVGVTDESVVSKRAAFVGVSAARVANAAHGGVEYDIVRVVAVFARVLVVQSVAEHLCVLVDSIEIADVVVCDKKCVGACVHEEVDALDRVLALV